MKTLRPVGSVGAFYFMLTSKLSFNPVLTAMTYHNEVLTLQFKKQSRTYNKVPKEIAYGLFYSKTPAIYFNEKIKKQFEVIKVC